MRICFLRIENFRGIVKADIPIPPHCAILGSNNCGKTAIANALAILFSRERWYQNISEYDFYGGNPSSDSRFNIIGTLTGFDSNDPLEFPEWFNTEKGARVAWWNNTVQRVSYDLEQPEGAELAVEIAVSGRYDDDNCEFEIRKYFYDGETDPFALDSFVPFPNKLLSKIGFFLIPSLRQWDWILSFGSGQFLKLLREIDGIPSEQINAFKNEIRNPSSKLEDASPFKELLESLEEELRKFTLMPNSSKVVYRTSQLSTRSALESLMPHLKGEDSSILPFSRQGAGFSSVQLLLVLLQFAIRRKSLSENTIFVAEEPELHLQPSLQRRLINRLRAYSNQMIVTTHSHHIASMFKPSEVVHITNNTGTLKPEIVYSGNISESELGNQARRLYLTERANFYEALLGQYILVPEGLWDWQWLQLWIRLAEATASEELPLDAVQPEWSLSAIEIIKTNESAIVPTLQELRRFRNDIIALLDGDRGGNRKIREIAEMDNTRKPKAIIQFGREGEIEDLASWIIEPTFASPGGILAELMADAVVPWTMQELGNKLKQERRKDNWELHENLVWEAYNCVGCRERAVAFLSDIARICSGNNPILDGWQSINLPESNIPLHTASFIRGVAP
jgi:putative ATP-dependent endonuclease of the OLD family